jgi:hypothetical protein
VTRHDTSSRIVLLKASVSPAVVVVVVTNVVSSRLNQGIPPLPHTQRSCADDRMCQGWRSHRVETSTTPFTQPIGSHTLNHEEDFAQDLLRLLEAVGPLGHSPQVE